jgi:hypothetical protein
MTKKEKVRNIYTCQWYEPFSPSSLTFPEWKLVFFISMAFKENVLNRRHLVGEVDVSRRVENVEQERLALDVLHQQADRHRLDGNAALL